LPTIVHIVDDDVSFSKAIGRLLIASGYQIVTYDSAHKLLDRLPGNVEAGVILLDVRIPDMSGPELQERLAALGSLLPIIFLSGYGDIPTSVQAIKAGAEDFLTKPVSKERLLDAIERAVQRYRAGRGDRDRLNSLHALVDRLTPREREVFELVVRGRISKQIAFQLGTTERTIKAHRKKIMEKLTVGSVAELVLIADQLGLLPTPSSKDESTMAKASDLKT